MIWTFGILLFVVSVSAKPGRIVGGEATSIQEYPSLVQVEYLSDWTGWSQGCAANILSWYWVLSAAHCFHGYNYSPEKTRIRAGSSLRNVGGKVHYVDFERNHPDFGKYSRYDSDITVVKLTRPFFWTSSIQRGTIVPQDFALPDNHSVIQAGWGKLFYDGVSPLRLHHVNVYTINHDICAKRYRDVGIGEVTQNMICTGLLDVGGRGTYQGDSGGPVYAQGEKGLVIAGVMSWGYRCANGTYPGVSASVASFSNWIRLNAI